MRTLIICVINAAVSVLMIATAYHAYHLHNALRDSAGAAHHLHTYAADNGRTLSVLILVIVVLIAGALAEMQKRRFAPYINIGIFGAGLASLAVGIVTGRGKYTDETGIAIVLFGVPLAAITLLYVVLYARGRPESMEI
jgi:hypothetical protein